MDVLGKTLLQRVDALLEARSDITRGQLGSMLRRGPSWISEFFAGTRTTNDLRLTIKIARVFGVTVDYLIGEQKPELDAGAVTLLAAWNVIPVQDRELILTLAGTLRKRVVPLAGESASMRADGLEGTRDRTRAKSDEHLRPIR